jgi:hypothetical protein
MRLQKIDPMKEIPGRIPAKPQLRRDHQIRPPPYRFPITNKHPLAILRKIPDCKIELENPDFHKILINNDLML